MKTIEEARELSKVMVGIGTSVGKKVVAFITDMSQPLGYTVGNKLEVVEAIETLQGQGPEDLTELCVEIGSYMVHLAEVTETLEEAKTLIREQISSNTASDVQHKLFEVQGGKLPNLDEFINVKEIVEVVSVEAGYIEDIDALAIGVAAMKLGAGRATKDDDIDPDVGIVLNKKVGDFVKEDEPLAYVYNNKEDIEDILLEISTAFQLTDKEVMKKPIIFEIIT